MGREPNLAVLRALSLFSRPRLVSRPHQCHDTWCCQPHWLNRRVPHRSYPNAAVLCPAPARRRQCVRIT